MSLPARLPAVLAVLVDRLTDVEAVVRLTAAEGLGRLGPDAVPAVSALIRALHDADPCVRHAVIQSLAAIGPSAVAAAPALGTTLLAADCYTRRLCLDALESIGVAALHAVLPALLAQVGATNWQVRLNAVSALTRLAPLLAPPPAEDELLAPELVEWSPG